MTDVVADGAKAWAKISKATTFEAWKAISLAVAIGRQAAMSEAKVNGPRGKRYARIFGGWLNDNGFAATSFHVRTACYSFADHMQEIETWRASLPEAHRENQNNVEVCLRNWRKSTKPASPPRRRITLQQAASGHDRPFVASGDQIKRAALAMAKTGGTDLFVMAAAAFATLTVSELVDFINEPQRTRPPRKVALAEATHA
jgi:hypothetical protein